MWAKKRKMAFYTNKVEWFANKTQLLKKKPGRWDREE